MLLLASAASAQAPQKRAIILHKEAGVHYNMGQYELAAAKYQAAIRADPSLPGPYRNLGLTYRAMKKCDLALPYFRKYLKMRPEGRHSDRVRQEVAYCEKLTGTTSDTPVGAAHIVLRCEVEGAQVHIDGELRGTTKSQGFPVQPGKHSVTVYRSGYKPWNGAVEVVEGQVAALDVKLERDPSAVGAAREEEIRRSRAARTPGRLRLVGLQRGMSVTLDGTALALDEDHAATVAPGTHEVRVEGRGLQSWTRSLTIASGETTSVMPVLEMSETGRRLRRWGWITTGAAAAVGLAAGLVGLVENRTHEKIRDYDRAAGSRQDLNDLVETRRREALAANVLFGVAGALLGTGAVLLMMAPESTGGQR